MNKNIVITYNIPLLMDTNTFLYWNTILSQCKDAYNLCSTFVYNYIHTNKYNDILNIKKLHNLIYYKLRDKFPLLPAQTIIHVCKDVIATFKSIKVNKHKNTNIPTRETLILRLDKRLYSTIDINGIKMSTGTKGKREIVKFMLYDKVINLFNNHSVSDPVLFIRDNKPYLSVPFNISMPIQNNKTAIGVDLGIKRFYVTSEGNAFNDKTYLKRKREIRYLKRCLQSKNTKSAKRHLNKVKHRERNINKDMCYRAANILINSTDASIIVMEDLSKIKKRTSVTKGGYKRTRHNNMISQVPFYQFRQILTYKAQLAGKQVETVSPSYTSQINSLTGKCDGKRVGCRYYCSDGKVLDADYNASVNIAQRSKHPVSKHVPIDGTLYFHTGRYQSIYQRVETPKVKKLYRLTNASTHLLRCV